ncbi:cysteine hydrolase [Bdellovibrio sp. SKB1291214]|uniref:cysteine hydrolase family protein n=1 Tax=Bdellovibrio sp. SKB1291214 TaxID=1732569 RepID=UPI000B51811A|nr:cysteine hydrolase family protein [Bdellovibrio sp. SKB1291214]UYL07375.1 cysteine hydrolase [Bdellovibrio sp. SKB1291214]
MNLNTALVIVDVQANMFAPENCIHGADELLENLQKLLYLSRASNTQVIFIQNNGKPGDPDEERTEGWLIHPELSIENGDLIVQKKLADPFTETELHSVLKKKGIQKLIIAGLQSEFCIEATCRKAADLGYGVTLVSDTHSTYASNGETAEQIKDRVNKSLKDIVTLWRVSDLEL